ncbi:BTB domain-containing protein [Trichonephila clavipes]|nr:BTB domain-containing protein [Trichonephila clavipes]
MKSVKSERWQKGIKSLKEGLAHIYETKEYADVHFVVGVRTFKAHRLILAARSPVFSKMLLKKQTDSSTIMKEIIDDVTEDGFEILLEYIYTDKLNDVDKDTLLDAHRAALTFQQGGLLRLCEERIAKWDITCDNVCSLLNQLSDIQSMKTRCLQFLKENALQVLCSDGLGQATAHTFWLMFEGGYFQHASPMARLKNAVRWAREQLPDNSDYLMVRDLLLKTRPILGKCSLDEFGSTDLATIIAEYKNLLTPEESTAFFVNIHSPGSMPLPSWCKPE